MDEQNNHKQVTATMAAGGQSEENMLGHGYYNKHSHAQGAANSYALPLLEEAVKGIDPAQAVDQFVIADYGSAQGRNSLQPVKTILSGVRSRWRIDLPVCVVHTDLPTNDFTTLFETVLQSPDSYLSGETNVFPFASGTSIYERIFPANMVALGYSAITVHWLSRKPTNIPGHIWSPRATGRVRDEWAAQARIDWQNFLGYRAAELKPSGKLVIVGSGADAAGDSGAESLIDLANDVLARAVAAGALFPDEYLDMAIPTYYRTPQEWTEPLTPASEFAVNNKLRLLRQQSVVLPDPYIESFRQTGDARAFAHSYAAFFRAFSEPCLFKSLREERTAEDRQALIDSFYQQVEEVIADDPPKYVCHWQLMLLEISKD